MITRFLGLMEDMQLNPSALRTHRVPAPAKIPNTVILKSPEPFSLRNDSGKHNLGSRKIPEPMEHGSKKVDGRSNLFLQPPGPAGNVLSRIRHLVGLSMYGTGQCRNIVNVTSTENEEVFQILLCDEDSKVTFQLAILHDGDDH